MKLIHFEKKLGLAGAISVSVGAVIGVGIFVIVGPIGASTGPWMPLAFVVAAVPAVFGTIVAVALGSTIPADGGGFFYSRSLLGRPMGAIVSFLIVAGAMGSITAVSTGIADYLMYSYLNPAYLQAVFGADPEKVKRALDFWFFPGNFRIFLSILIILFTWGVNAIGLMASEKFQIFMVVQLVAALVLIVAIALVKGVTPDFSQPLPAGTGGFFQGCVIAMMTYTGFNIIGEMGDEVKNPRRNLPLTIIFGLGIITVVYVGIGWLVSGSMTVAEMKTSKAALLDASIRQYSAVWFWHFLNLAAVFAGLTSINAVFLAVPREFSALAEDGLLPKWIMKFNAQRGTFPIGIAITSAIGAAITLLNLTPDLYSLLCVSGLMLANMFFSVAALRLTKVFPEQVANAPLKIRNWWLFPSSIISAVLSLAFGLFAIYFFWPLLFAIGGSILLGLVLAAVTKSPQEKSQEQIP